MRDCISIVSTSAVFHTFWELWIGDSQCKCSQEDEVEQVKTQVDEVEEGNVSEPLPSQKTAHYWVEQ